MVLSLMCLFLSQWCCRYGDASYALVLSLWPMQMVQCCADGYRQLLPSCHRLACAPMEFMLMQMVQCCADGYRQCDYRLACCTTSEGCLLLRPVDLTLANVMVRKDGVVTGDIG